MRSTSRTPPVDRARTWVGSHADVVTVVFLAALVAGTILRVVGLTWGLPMGLHPDEPVIVKGALDLAQRNSFEPKYFMRPDHVEIQLSYLAYQAYAHLVRNTSVEAAYALDPGAFLLISRSVTVMFGVAMIVLAYAIGRRLDRRIGAIAAVLVALMPIFVRDSHYATPDIPLTCMLMVVVLALMHYLATPRLAPLLVACAATAVGIAIKYPAAIATVMIAIVVIIAALHDRRPPRIVTHGVIAAATVLGSLFVISPALFTNVEEVRAALTRESRPTHVGADGLSWSGNLGFYAESFFTDVGVLLTVAVVIGLVAAVRRRLYQAIPLALGAVYWVVLSAVPLHWDRWGIPIYVTPLMFAAIGVFHAYRWAGRRRWRTPVAWGLGALAVVNLLAGGIAHAANLSAPDSRLAARPLFRESGITPDVTSYEGYTPLLPSRWKQVFGEFRMVGGRPTPIDPDMRYLVLSSGMFNRYLADPKYVAEQAFYAGVKKNFTLLASYKRVEQPARSGIEPIDILDSVRTTLDYLAGGKSGPEVYVYAIE
jgi:hypothetical protein